jgi:hypothetical protein
MLDGYVARELPNEVWSAKISRKSERRMSKRVDQWGRFDFFFRKVEVFQEMEMEFLFLTHV